MNLFPRFRRGEPVPQLSDEHAEEKFLFLLFVLDSINGRNLPCDGPLYSAILSYGSRVGGLSKKIASLLVWAKTMSTGGSSIINDAPETTSQDSSVVSSWEELYGSYDELQERLSSPALLPKTVVRVNRADVVKVLRAERSLSYRPRQRLEV